MQFATQFDRSQVSDSIDIYGGGVNFRKALAFRCCGCVSRETLPYGGAILPIWWHLCVLGCCFESAKETIIDKLIVRLHVRKNAVARTFGRVERLTNSN